MHGRTNGEIEEKSYILVYLFFGGKKIGTFVLEFDDGLKQLRVVSYVSSF